MKRIFHILPILFISFHGFSQTDTKIYDIINNISANRIQSDIETLANFGTRHTLSDTISETRGIGAARRWIKKEFDKISNEHLDCKMPPC